MLGKEKIPKNKETVLDEGFGKVRASRIESGFGRSVLAKSVMAVLLVSAAILLIIAWMDKIWPAEDYLNNLFCNVLAMVFIVAFVDTVVRGNEESRRKRDEARSIIRYNRIIQPDIDMYLVRKNMVVTPAGKSVKKFQVDSDFTIQDMRDMYGASELASDVGISKINRYAHFQARLRDDFAKMVEGVDFTYYPEIAEACMKYINATSYGEAALQAVVSYEDAKYGTKSMKTIVVQMIKDEPAEGRYMSANPTMKNVYLVHQMINDQEQAVSDYLRLINILLKQERASIKNDTDYE